MTKEIRKASELRPWLKNFPEGFRNIPLMQTTLEQHYRNFNPDWDRKVLEYYDTQWSTNEMFAMADKVAKALAAAGVKCGDHIACFMEFQPEFVFLLFAAEKIGAALVCRDGSKEEYIQAIRDAKGPVAIIQDFFEKDMEETFYEVSPELKHIIAVNPYTYAQKDKMPEYVIENIEARYTATTIDKTADAKTLSWDTFMAGGEGFTGEYLAPADPFRNLYHPYTSGSTGPSKEIQHCAATMTAVLGQTCPLMAQIPFAMRCLLPVLPPALIAMVGPIFILYTSTGHTEILDPYCGIDNHDLEMMRLMPNGTIGISQLGRNLLFSKRIPADMQFPMLLQLGGGAEPVNKKFMKRFQDWLKQHGAVHCSYTMGYGMTEAGPVISMPGFGSTHENLESGFPLPHNIVGVFDEDCNELDYADIGEICISSPGVMIGYSKQEDTDQAIKIHADGRRWLHTGDHGFFNDKGELTVVCRGLEKTYMGGNLHMMHMENKVIGIKGIEDCFFMSVPDHKHEGYKRAWMYLIMEDGADLEAIKEEMKNCLEPFEYPEKIKLIEERPWFHFKTARRVIIHDALAEIEEMKKNL